MSLAPNRLFYLLLCLFQSEADVCNNVGCDAEKTFEIVPIPPPQPPFGPEHLEASKT